MDKILVKIQSKKKKNLILFIWPCRNSILLCFYLSNKYDVVATYNKVCIINFFEITFRLEKR